MSIEPDECSICKKVLSEYCEYYEFELFDWKFCTHCYDKHIDPRIKGLKDESEKSKARYKRKILKNNILSMEIKG